MSDAAPRDDGRQSDLAIAATLLGRDVSRLDRDAALAELQRSERALEQLHSLQAALLVAVASSSPVVEELLALDPRPGRQEERRMRIEDAVREEVAPALHWTPAHAQSRIDEARLLLGPLRDTLSALRAGAIAPRHAAEISAGAERLPGRDADPRLDPVGAHGFDRLCAALQRRALPVARRGPAGRTRAAVHRAVLALDPEGWTRRRVQARCTRDVRIYDEPDGISTLFARLATEQAHALMAAVDAAAAVDPDPAVRIGERRADALVGLALGSLGAPLQVRLDVVTDLAALMLDAQTADSATAVAVVAGSTVPIDAVRDLLAMPEVVAQLRRIVTDPVTGRLSGVGRTSYRVPEPLRAFIARRDGHCRFPGCARPAARCQVDHATSWDDGGSTDPANLGSLCIRHHQLKTFGGWQIAESSSDGTCRWLSPSGRRHATAPEPMLVDPDPPPF